MESTHLSESDNRQNLFAHARLQENALILERFIASLEKRHRRELTALEETLRAAVEKHRHEQLEQQQLYEKVMREVIANTVVNPRDAFPEIAAELAAERAELDVSEEMAFVREHCPDVAQAEGEAQLEDTLRISRQYEEQYSESPTTLERMQSAANDPEFRQALAQYGSYGVMAAVLIGTGGSAAPAMAASMAAKQAINKIAPVMGTMASHLAERSADILVERGVLSPATREAAEQNLNRLTHRATNNRYFKFAKWAGITAATMAAGIASAEALSPNFTTPSVDGTPADAAGDLDGPRASSAQPDASSAQPDLPPETAAHASPTIEASSLASALHEAGLNANALMLFQSGATLDQTQLIDLVNLAGEQGPEIMKVLAQQGVDTTALQDGLEQTWAQEGASAEANADGAAGDGLALGGEVLRHTVQPGDTLSEIIYETCRAQGIEVDAALLYGENGEPGLVDSITAHNGSISDADLIYPGNTVAMPLEILNGNEAALGDAQACTPDTHPPEGAQVADTAHQSDKAAINDYLKATAQEASVAEDLADGQFDLDSHLPESSQTDAAPQGFWASLKDTASRLIAANSTAGAESVTSAEGSTAATQETAQDAAQGQERQTPAQVIREAAQRYAGDVAASEPAVSDAAHSEPTTEPTSTADPGETAQPEKTTAAYRGIRPGPTPS